VFAAFCELAHVHVFAAVCLSVGSTKDALKILMHVSCPSLDERDEQGFCHLFTI